ncbi:MAG: hypothetical protein M3O41_04930 [Pseudomonadota bacterium]|nr:hypothetical protein [Pseudomonadota bacterium]
MRKYVALVIAVGAVVIALFLRYREIESWFWATQIVSGVWVFTGIWYGKVNLGRTHGQLVKDEVRGANRWSPLTRVLIWGACWLDPLAIVLYFTTT